MASLGGCEQVRLRLWRSLEPARREIPRVAGGGAARHGQHQTARTRRDLPPLHCGLVLFSPLQVLSSAQYLTISFLLLLGNDLGLICSFGFSNDARLAVVVDRLDHTDLLHLLPSAVSVLPDSRAGLKGMPLLHVEPHQLPAPTQVLPMLETAVPVLHVSRVSPSR